MNNLTLYHTVMSEPTPERPSVFIEKVMPVKLLNEQVDYEHGGNPFKGLHRWYSRKPLLGVGRCWALLNKDMN